MHVTRNDNTTVCLGVLLNEERNKNWAGYLTCLICQAPYHKKANELFSWPPAEGRNHSVGSAGAGGRDDPAPALDGWDWWRVSTHILPAYEQQICPCVTGWRPRSQMLVQCCYISTLSKCSAQRQSAPSVRGRQVARSESIGLRLPCQNALKRCNLNPHVPLQLHITGFANAVLQIRFAKQRR